MGVSNNTKYGIPLVSLPQNVLLVNRKIGFGKLSPNLIELPVDEGDIHKIKGRERDVHAERA